MNKHINFIDGEWTDSSGDKMQSISPIDNQILWEGYTSKNFNIDQAINAAKNALPLWAKLSIEKRTEYLKEYKSILEENKEHLTIVISLETGKPLWESSGEVAAMIGKIDISIKAYADRSPTTENQLKGSKSITRHKPHGVLAVLGPYNFPGHLPNGHIVPALLAGNTIVFKPSELTPYTAQEMVRLWEKAKLPNGVLNLVQGGKETAISLSKNERIDGLLFTGSWKTGSSLAKQFVNFPGKILALEMGGNNPLIVTHPKNIAAAAYTTILSAYITSGQRCTCARRLIVLEGSDGDEFIETLVKMIKNITVGKYSDSPEPFMGPVINKETANALLKTQDSLIKSNGCPIIKMERLDINNTFLTPGLIDVSSIENRADKEYFGPLLQLIRVNNFDEAIAEANKTEYGLSAGLLSDSKNEYDKFFYEIKAGIVNWNTQTTGASSGAPFGGVGKSGNYHPSAYYATDYCSYPVASIEAEIVTPPATLSPGLSSLEEMM